MVNPGVPGDISAVFPAKSRARTLMYTGPLNPEGTEKRSCASSPPAISSCPPEFPSTAEEISAVPGEEPSSMRYPAMPDSPSIPVTAAMSGAPGGSMPPGESFTVISRGGESSKMKGDVWKTLRVPTILLTFTPKR